MVFMQSCQRNHFCTLNKYVNQNARVIFLLSFKSISFLHFYISSIVQFGWIIKAVIVTIFLLDFQNISFLHQAMWNLNKKINIWCFIKTYFSRYTTFEQNTRQYSVMPNLIFCAERKKRHYWYLSWAF